MRSRADAGKRQGESIRQCFTQNTVKENDMNEKDELLLSPGPLVVIDDSSETKSDQDEDDQDCQVGYRVSK